MACMEHTCRKCGYLVLNNTSKFEEVCPDCGNDTWVTIWDEEIFENKGKDPDDNKEEEEDDE